MKPTPCQRATREAVRSATSTDQAVSFEKEKKDQHKNNSRYISHQSRVNARNGKDVKRSHVNKIIEVLPAYLLEDKLPNEDPS